MINKKFNRWLVLEESGKDKWGSLLYKCLCDCGNVSITRGSDIRSNKSLQCRECGYLIKRKGTPLLKSPIAGKGNNYRHGKCGTDVYKCWCSMINRCSASGGRDFKWYGSRGIKVCDEWRLFDNFYKDMGEKPNKMYLDRINNDLGYFKGNCRWASATVNSRNRRCVK